ncbi:hypothetical protein [Pontibacter vulgaris]|uniref:hypothetical protein n=1 Tax=Pontibacter vulgaris TaxID=2905679 RepID=UPI001FA76617|nr:hypothetical protein [Pontibacter vulgaris]
MLFLFRKWQHTAAFSLLLLAGTACSSSKDSSNSAEPEPGTKIYTIKKGAHSSSSPFKTVSTSLMRFEVVFDSTAIYSTSTPSNQADINKLYGLSDCKSDHHTNSARFGWRWYKNQLEIHAYTYKNKKRQSAYIGSVAIGKPAVYEIKIEDNEFVFTLNGVQTRLPRACNGIGEGYQLYPYFGGDEVAPHDIKIKIKELL